MQVLINQEFTYRESPAEQDGYGKFKALYGNTLTWNQLVPSLSIMSAQNGTISVADNVATITGSSSVSYLGIATSGSSIVLPKGGHKYLMTVEVNSSKALTSCNLWYGKSITYIQRNIPANTWTKVSTILSSAEPTGQYIQLRAYGSFEQGDTMQVRNWNYFDLTAMGLDSITTIEEFTSLFSLPYYDYNKGTLLSFNGTGLKTIGFNQWDEQWEVGAYQSSNGDKANNVRDRIRNKNPICIFPSTNYYVSKGLQFYYYDANMNFLSWNNFANPTIITTPSNACYMNFNGLANTGTTYNHDICINISDTSKNGTYEPYTSSTTSLPISTYFPTGMKSAGSVYDELTESKAITRIGAVDLGSLTWNRTAINEGYAFVSSIIADIMPTGNVATANVLCANYTLSMGGNGYYIPNDKTYRVGGTYFGVKRVIIRDDSYTDANTFKTAMAGVPLLFELETPLENYGVVDLGSLTWSKTQGSTASNTRFYTNGIQNVIKRVTSNNDISNILTNRYKTIAENTGYLDQADGISSDTNGTLSVYDSTYSTVEDFKQAMQGVYLLYDKKNPQGLVYPPQSKDEYPFFKSFKGGTEQLLPENGSVPVTSPILADMNYSSGAIGVTTFPNPEQGGETSGDGWYLVGEEATVNATPNEHYAFNNWVLDGEIVSTDPEYTFEVQDE